jgi:hypothetical protein
MVSCAILSPAYSRRHCYLPDDHHPLRHAAVGPDARLRDFLRRYADCLRLIAHQVQRVGCLHWWRATTRHDSAIRVRGGGAQSQDLVVLSRPFL